MIISQSLECALIRTLRKLRSSPNLQDKEIIGLFVNFLYLEHSPAKKRFLTAAFYIRRIDGILTIGCKNQPYGMDKHIFLVKEELEKMEPADFYLLYLKSSFEDPKEGYYDRLKEVYNVEPESFVSKFIAARI
jgi:hypothetical protein